MSATDKPQKISIGFHGGQVLAARIHADELGRLRAALPTSGWHDLRAEEGSIAVDLGRVEYVLVENEEHRVGF